MARITAFRAALPDLGDVLSFDDFFGAAKRKFSLYLNDGVYEQTALPALFIYRIKRPHRSHTGIIAQAAVEDYIQGLVKKHEHTLQSKEVKMVSLIDERKALIKPVLLTYPNVLEIDALINRYTIGQRPDWVIPFENEEHLFWQINEPTTLETLVQYFAEKVPATYICDGHHRSKACEQRYHQAREANPEHQGTEAYNFFLSAFFPASEIEIHNYNRYLSSLKGLSPQAFLKALATYFDVQTSAQPFVPQRKHDMGLYLDKTWYRLRLHNQYLPQNQNPNTEETLDVHLLNEYVFKQILGIEDVRLEADVKYLEGPKGYTELEQKVASNKALAAFNLYPLSMTELIAVSDQNHTLPPKSTWIEPRMRNGFVAMLYNDL